MMGFCGLVDARDCGGGVKIIGYGVLALLFGGMTSLAPAQKRAAASPGLAELEKMTSRFAPIPLRVDTSRLSPGDRQALVKLLEASRILDEVFLEQLWNGNVALYAQLQKDRTPLGKARQHYFWLNKGPWSSIDQNKAFLPGVPPHKPLGANFYPPDMTKQDFEGWIAGLPEKDQEQAKSFFTVIRWKDAGAGGHGQLEAIPYSEAYKDNLRRAAGLLKEAAELTQRLAEAISPVASRCVLVQRLLRE